MGFIRAQPKNNHPTTPEARRVAAEKEAKRQARPTVGFFGLGGLKREQKQRGIFSFGGKKCPRNFCETQNIWRKMFLWLFVSVEMFFFWGSEQMSGLFWVFLLAEKRLVHLRDFCLETHHLFWRLVFERRHFFGDFFGTQILFEILGKNRTRNILMDLWEETTPVILDLWLGETHLQLYCLGSVAMYFSISVQIWLG